MNIFSWLFANTIGRLKSHSVTLTWNPEPIPVNGFNIYRSPDEIVWHKIAFTAQLTYVDKNVRAGQTWFYRITAVGITGVESPSSTDVKAMVPLW